jgi:RNA polymerase sigma-70 factor (ECF subfamily)
MSMREETDGQLVVRARGGDISAFEVIVNRHRAAIVALAASRLGSLADAEDVAQEAFVQAFFRLDQLRDAAALLPWLRRLTDRLALTRLRRRREEPLEPARVERMRAAEPEPAGETRGLL